VFSNFFIVRPVFATVCALLIVLVGAVSIPTLPIAQFPELAAPQVQVTSNYVGANAQVVEAAVTTPLESQINGVEGMRYMQSTSGSDGSSAITVTFDVERNKDQAAVDVLNRVNTALASLPTEVKNTGVTVTKTTPAILMAAGFYSKDGSLSPAFVSNYVAINVVDALKRLPGVGDVRIFGERRYAMRLWLSPDLLAARGLTATDVLNALREQNAQIAPGQVGQPPSVPGQSYQISVRAMGRLTDPHEFENIVIRAGADGTLITLKDVARVELGAQDYATRLRFDEREAVGIGIFQLPDANALDIDKQARATLEKLSRQFPPSLEYNIAFNPTVAVRDSIREVLKTLAEAIIIVILVIFIFLQDWRTTLIPAITIPVSLIGTFGFIKAFGFSINTLTLFGIVLATGLVVDDAIVVVENIARNLGERRGEPRAATEAAMAEVSGAVVATSLVLIAVFVPVAFTPGTAGRLYKQFSLTIAFAVAISMFNALTLSPALAALLMRPPGEKRFVLFRWFNRGFDRLNQHYRRASCWLTGHLRWVALAFAAGLALTFLVFRSVPTGFVPDEDLNYTITQIQAPPGASLEYTEGVVKQVEGILKGHQQVNHLFSVLGFSFTGNGPNRAVVFSALKPLADRKSAKESAMALVADLRIPLLSLPGAIVVPFLPPPIQGQGSTGGFTFEVLDQGNSSFETLAGVSRQVSGEAMRSGAIGAVFTTFTVDDPQLVLRIDREKTKSVGIPLSEVNNALSVYMGSSYINDFDFNNRSYRVYAQADSAQRASPASIGALYVRAASGGVVPLEGLVSLERTTAPPVISHFNLYRSVELNGAAAPGVSSGQAIAAMNAAASRVLPPQMTSEWSGLSWEEVRTGGRTMVIFLLALLFVYLTLSAQYESFALPLVIILAVPLAVLGALTAQKLRGLINDVYCQIGLVMLIGMASKNAILIVEFAEQLRARGMSEVEAVIEAAHLRLRPILMTSFAFILGVLPLVFATGSGALSRHSLGTAVMGGLLLSTVLNLFFTPALYLVMRRVLARLRPRPRPAPAPVPEGARA
jgi:hydrophobic/amphiphilic exporter-1 (mainly G- bacteria), HAE1 family